jgi:hypothetical protein
MREGGEMTMKRVVLLSVVIACIAAAPAMAVVSYSGSLTGGDGVGIYAPDNHGFGNPWDSASTVISWDVTQVGGSWHYEYDFTVPSKNFSHVIIEVSDGATITGLTGATSEGPDTYKTTGPGASNPELPADIFGIKFSPTGDTTHFVWEFDSVRSPVWGDFYAKDGKNGTGPGDHTDVVMWNKGFLLADPTNAPANGSIDWKILRPDTETEGIPTPELSTWMLLGLSGLAGGFAALRRRKS